MNIADFFVVLDTFHPVEGVSLVGAGLCELICEVMWPCRGIVV